MECKRIGILYVDACLVETLEDACHAAWTIRHAYGDYLRNRHCVTASGKDLFGLLMVINDKPYNTEIARICER